MRLHLPGVSQGDGQGEGHPSYFFDFFSHFRPPASLFWYDSIGHHVSQVIAKAEAGVSR
jgi:hypothetical protein